MAKNKQQQEKPTVSFDEMIKAGMQLRIASTEHAIDVASTDRQKRKAENLAQEIFGKNRRQSAPQNNNNKKQQTQLGGSLASRVGITKARSIRSNRQTGYILIVTSVCPRPLPFPPWANNSKTVETRRTATAVNH